ncbi:hypothetical protein SAMN06272771_2638 [Streptomyces sp. Ag82_O1-12]|uniref:hypothetical protein n=1 Tax=unclassified Streptomyces TaxID=2593676 RepID=UPI000BC69979|nr:MULTISPECIES: hypothetical protein [unclassified Streptomyces]SMQ16277.1 hypothetical protein SAMN06272771_2638 [Streptomyces sp. Ag82_O1-12]SOD45307.1 hypothetical protein SAMN06272727_2633 [Streptomyces sp. Ag82_G6-1]
MGSGRTVYAPAAGTGKELWRSPTGSGEMAVVPDDPEGTATSVPEGVLTFSRTSGDALDIPYGVRSACTVDVRDLRERGRAA